MLKDINIDILQAAIQYRVEATNKGWSVEIPIA